MGSGQKESLRALQDESSGLHSCDFESVNLPTYIGRIRDIEKQPLPDKFYQYESRNNRLAYQALHLDGFLQATLMAKEKYGATRVGVILGTTTSGFLQAEKAYQNRDENDALPDSFHYKKTAHPFATVDFLRCYLELEGPALAICTACSSSAKIFATASRWLSLNLCDAVIACGIDSLCANTLHGFHSLGLLSEKPCQPSDKNRSGLSVGEGAAFVLLERADEGEIGLLGYGESCDAYHMSSPHPEGFGAISSMKQAISMSGLSVNDIDYINHHGTASPVNDKMEDKAIYDLFGNRVVGSSTKGWTGHTLGAAGAVEVVLSVLCMKSGLMPKCLNTQEIDPDFRSSILLQSKKTNINNILTNSFGFGGNNCSLVIGKLT